MYVNRNPYPNACPCTLERYEIVPSVLVTSYGFVTEVGPSYSGTPLGVALSRDEFEAAVEACIGVAMEHGKVELSQSFDQDERAHVILVGEHNAVKMPASKRVSWPSHR